MTPNPGFKITAYLKWNISKTVRFTDKLTMDFDSKLVASENAFCKLTLSL